jgi:hypothetical protein
MKHFFTRYRVAVLFALVLVIQAFAEWVAWKKNLGNFCYALDDSFIMMAISKNLALHGVWGVTQYEFSATATSPIFTILLALFFKIFGVSIYIPLIINLLVVLLLLYYCDKEMLNLGISAGVSKYILLLVVFITPFFALLSGGMEHLLHLATFIWLLFSTSRYIDSGYTDNKTFYLMLLAGFITVGVRYESGFLVAFIALWLTLHGRFLKAVGLSFVSALPIIIYGLYSMYQGSYFLPNSVLLKGVFVNFMSDVSASNPIKQIIKKLLLAPWVISLLVIGYIVWVTYCKGYIKEKAKENFLVLAILFTTLAHILVGWVGHVFRYEAYLMGAGTLVLSAVFIRNEGIKLLKDLFYKVTGSSDYFSLLLVSIMLYFPLSRGYFSYTGAIKAKTNIFEQQVQMGKFLHEHYNNASVGASDIGAISYYSDIRLLDFYGLASIEIVNAKLKKQYTLHKIDSLARAKGMQMVVFYDQGLDNSVLKWYLVRRWYIKDNLVCGFDSVSFYAPTYQLAKELSAKLDAFEPKLPPRVSTKRFEFAENVFIKEDGESAKMAQ